MAASDNHKVAWPKEGSGYSVPAIEDTRAVAGMLQWRATLVALAALWASNFVSTKLIFDAVPELHVSEMMALRFGIAGAAMLPFVTKHLWMQWDSVITGLEIGFWIMLGYCGQAIGLLTTTAGKSAFISSLSVVWVALVSGVLNRAFEPRILLCSVLAVTGIGWLELAGSQGAPVIGDIWSLAQPIFFGWGYIRLEQRQQSMAAHEQAGGSDEASLTLSASKIIFCALASAAWAVADGGSAGMDSFHLDTVLASGTATAALLWMGLITTAGALTLETEAFKWVPATDATIILSAQPLMATGIAYTALHEPFGVTDAIGSSLIIAACLLNELLASSATDGSAAGSAGAARLVRLVDAGGCCVPLQDLALDSLDLKLPGLSECEGAEWWVCPEDQEVAEQEACREVYYDGEMVVACAY